MNHKQKLGYILLGAGIMAVGITIGQFVTPNIEAQSNGVFDKITCREIEVVDKDGDKAIGLGTEDGWTRLTFWEKFGEKALVLENKEHGGLAARGLTVYQALPGLAKEAIVLKYALDDTFLLITENTLGSTLIDGQTVKAHQLEVRDYNHYPAVRVVGGRHPVHRGVIVYGFESPLPVIELKSSRLDRNSGHNSLRILDPSSENVAIALFSHREENGNRLDKDGFDVNRNVVYLADTTGKGAITLRGDSRQNVLSIHDKYDEDSIAFRAGSAFDSPDGLNFAVKRDRKTGVMSDW